MRKLVRKWWFWAIVVFLILGAIGSQLGGNDKPAAPSNDTTQTQQTADPLIEYSVVTDDDVSIAGQTRHTFRIIVAADAAEEQLLAVFEKVDMTDVDNVTAWFYSDQTAVDAGTYNVAMIERTNKETPVVTMR